MPNAEEPLSNRLRERFEQYRGWWSLARRQTGKSFVAQLRDIHDLRQAGGHCGVSDYYWYKLYDDVYQTGRGARDFVGWRLQQEFSLALNPRTAVLPAWDKLVFTTLASAAGLPIAPIRACYHPAKRVAAELGEHLRTTSAAGVFLRNPSIYPLFAKPSFSQQGIGSSYLASYDPATDALRMLNGSTISMADFIRRLEHSVDPRYHRPEAGFVFQDPLMPAPEIRTLTDWPAICGVRVICLNGPDGVTPIGAFWKISTSPNHVDNFSKGKYGNLVANVDLENGVVSRALSAFWPNTKIHLDHPQTGRRLEGFCLPDWPKVIETCHAGGAAFPLMRIQHWDIALTDGGPVVQELNDIGATEVAQLHGRGLLTEETREFLKRYGNSSAYPWIKRL